MTIPIARPTGDAPVAASYDPRGAEPPGSLLLHAAATLARRWRLVAGAAFLTMVVGTLAALLLPKTYLSGTLLVPFAGSASRSSIALGNLPSGIAGLVSGSIGGGSPAERILAPVLGSATLNDTIVHRVARGSDEELIVRKVLRNGVRVARNPDGSILVQVRAPNPELAARVANAYPGAVNHILIQVSAEGAVVKQAFLRNQIDSAGARLSESERKLIDFAQRRSAPAAEQQAQRTIDAAASLQQRIFEQELAVAQLRRTSTPDNPELRAAEALLASEREQLRQLTSGTRDRSVFVPFERGAELRVASTRVERDYQQDQRVYSSLVAALTDAQIDANNSLPVLSVLDPAYPPADPTTSVPEAAVLSLGVGAVLGVLLALGTESLARTRRDPANAAHYAVLDGLRRNGRRPADAG
ncbi:LPS biosynthesis protein [Gemmatimonadetes bacterium T265]|nr:LPS biosynthesis protein [Gemmatimonadetes bacterium T265]